jgi:hypothetical protein
MTTGIQATIASAYADGVCMACETPERGVLVTLLDIALPAPVAREGGGCSVAAQGRLLLTLCWEHHNLLRDQLNKLGERREI